MAWGRAFGAIVTEDLQAEVGRRTDEKHGAHAGAPLCVANIFRLCVPPDAGKPLWPVLRAIPALTVTGTMFGL